MLGLQRKWYSKISYCCETQSAKYDSIHRRVHGKIIWPLHCIRTITPEKLNVYVCVTGTRTARSCLPVMTGSLWRQTATGTRCQSSRPTSLTLASIRSRLSMKPRDSLALPVYSSSVRNLSHNNCKKILILLIIIIRYRPRWLTRHVPSVRF